MALLFHCFLHHSKANVQLINQHPLLMVDQTPTCLWIGLQSP